MLVLSNVGKLYDGSGAGQEAVHRGVDVHIDGERIASLGPHDPHLSVDGDHVLVDASSYTVTPGLIDCHGHVTALGIDSASLDRSNDPGAMVYVEKVLHRSLVEGGVTTMRDVGGATHAMKRLVDEGLIIGPRLKIAICMLSTTGGHADFRGPDRCHATISRLWPEGPGRPSSIVDGPWECRKRVREIAACGGDLIKLCTSPGVASPGDRLEHRDFSPEEIMAITEEAGARGLRVAAHAHSVSGIRLAIENGVNDIQHISFMTEELVEAADRRGCTVTPTSWVVRALLDAELSPFVREKAEKVAEVHATAVDFARKGGLKILMGTDPVLPGMHGRNWLELVALMDEGLSSLQAWHGATGLAAHEVGQTDSGILEAGRRADLLICAADVVDDPRHFQAGALLEVVKDGLGYRGGVAAFPQRRFEGTVRDLLGELPKE
jgi:imidazolonepropionase-like amidohydrolase